jgi:PAS domain S-box-containing protein
MPYREVMVRRQKVLADFGDLAIKSDNLDEVLTEACRLVGEALGTGHAKILEIQEGTSELFVRAGIGWPPNVVGQLRLPMSEHSSETFSIKIGEPVITHDISNEKRFDIPEFLKDAQIVSLINVPIFVPGMRPYGILQVDSTQPYQFDDDDIQFLRTYATVLGPVIDRLELATERAAIQGQRAAELEAMKELQRVSTELVGEHDPKVLYQRIVQAAVVLMQSAAASIQVLNISDGGLDLLAWEGFHPESAKSWRKVKTDTDSSCGLALKTGERIVIPDMDHFDGEAEDVQAYRRSGLLSVQSTPLRAFSGQIVGMLSTHWSKRRTVTAKEYQFFDVLARLSADLIERVQENIRLRESEERLRQFGDASQDVLWLRDTKTLQWQYLTPAFETIYGLGREEALLGDNYKSWIELIVPEDRAIARDAVQRVCRGEHVTFDYRIRRPADGEIRWLRDTDFPITNSSGEITVFGGVGHDLTELRETETRLQTLVDGIPHLVWRAVEKGSWTWASQQWTDFTGQPEAESHGWGWLDALHVDDHIIARDAWSTATENNGFEVEYRIRQAISNSYRWFQTRATPVRDINNTIVEWLGTSTDIDDLRRLQARQQVLVTELQHRTFNLMGLVRSVADETVRSSRSLAEFQPKFRERVDALARVQRLMSRLTEGERVFFDELIRSELSAVGALDNGNDRVTLEGPAGVGLRSSTVQTFAMAIHELITNAVKYGALKQLAGRLYVGWRLDEDSIDGESWLHVDWHETGVVMPSTPAHTIGTGQGRILIEEALPYQLNARTSYTLGSDGVKCSISLPVSGRG